MQKLYITMIKDILNLININSVNINKLCYKIGITKKTFLEYLNLEKSDFAMYLLIIDTIKGGNYE